MSNHSLKRSEWLTLFDNAGWREKVASALREVASSRDADPKDRQTACALWSELTRLELVPGPKVSVPEMIRDVYIDLLVARVRNEATARSLHDLLLGASAMVELALQVVELPRPGEKPTEATAPKLDVN